MATCHHCGKNIVLTQKMKAQFGAFETPILSYCQECWDAGVIVETRACEKCRGSIEFTAADIDLGYTDVELCQPCWEKEEAEKATRAAICRGYSEAYGPY